jgi:hypothetical protein
MSLQDVAIHISEAKLQLVFSGCQVADFAVP